VFLPLGGNTKNEIKILSSMFLTMFIAGAWHGPNYLIWGIYCGTAQAIYLLYRGRCRKYRKRWLNSSVYDRLSWALMSIVTIVGVFLIKVCQKDSGLSFVRRIQLDGIKDVQLVVEAILLYCIGIATPLITRLIVKAWFGVPLWVRVQTTCYCAGAVWIWTGTAAAPFIYFQF
jgi:hypothetical protein